MPDLRAPPRNRIAGGRIVANPAGAGLSVRPLIAIRRCR
jgi:hypothetical protein